MADPSLIRHLTAEDNDCDGSESLCQSFNTIINYANASGYEQHHAICIPLLVLINRLEDNNLAPIVSGDLPSDDHLDRINSVRETLIDEKGHDLPEGA